MDDVIVTIKNIDYVIDIDQALEKLDDMTAEKAAEALEIPKDQYANMHTNERHDYARDLWHHSPATLEEFMEAPKSIELPDPLSQDWDEETVTDWLTEETGFNFDNYEIECNKTISELEALNAFNLVSML